MSSIETTSLDLRAGDRVRIAGRYVNGVGEVLRVQQMGGLLVADGAAGAALPGPATGLQADDETDDRPAARHPLQRRGG